MTRKDYVRIAAVLAESDICCSECQQGLAEAMADTLAADNPRFDRVRFLAACEVTAEVTYCGWWAMCANEATTTRHHPIMGDVPICDQCNTRVQMMADDQ